MQKKSILFLTELKKRMKISLLFVALSLFSIACNQKKSTTADKENVEEIELVYHVEGMTCDHCEKSIQKGVNELNGISLVEANHEDSTAHVVYNPAETDAKEIIAAIEKRGYHVVE
ncbi:heavy-metal-associated domain-containing protein [Sunxiuqinia indica]|uniref:heavy-metal-associated domain-containing protein n=1 Tax=Sunxiuqinia indica TaxID=2692584 RepID=UPI0013587124|nr:cation transporter [Sunxiuqinia indica]